MRRLSWPGRKVRASRISLWAAILLTTVALAAATAPLPANAVVGHQLCETYGSHYCVATGAVDNGILAYEGIPGRDLFTNQLSGTFHGFNIFQLVFSADNTQCLAGRDGGSSVEIENCGSTGTVWAMDLSSGHIRFINRYLSSCNGCSLDYLAGSNDGGFYYVALLGGSAFYNFDWGAS
jgi:hypothetical protein